MIYRYFGKIYLEKKRDRNELYGRDEYSCFRLNKKIRFLAYSEHPFFVDVDVDLNGRPYIAHFSGRPQIASVFSGTDYVKPASTDGKNIEPEFQYALLNAPEFDQYSFYISKWDKPGIEGQLVLCDRISESCRYRNCTIIATNISDGLVYGNDNRDKTFYCLNDSLEIVWKWHDERQRRFIFQGDPRIIAPMFCNEYVIYYFGIQTVEQVKLDDLMLTEHKHALLNIFNKYTGELIWSLDLEYRIDHMLIIDTSLYISTRRMIFVYDIPTGRQIKMLDVSEKSNPPRRFNVSNNTFYYENNLIFFCDVNSQCIRLYDRDLVEQGEICIPQPWAPTSFHFKDEGTGYLYFYLAASPENRVYYHREALLEIDPANLMASVEMEPEPDILVEMRPSDTEEDFEELWVEINCANLDDALRFGEIYTQDYAYKHGKALMQHCNENPKFNGKVHFRYSGSAASREEIEEKLRIMEKRFDLWNSKAKVYSGEGQATPCTLEAQYIP